MLMTQRAWIDAMRVLVYTNAAALDMADAERAAGDAETANTWQELADLLIPLSKSLCTDVGCEMTSLALQIHGGMGYVEETGAAQHFRDARIAPIYEGTNGIQAADLVGRKLAVRGGASFLEFIATMRELDGELTGAGDEFASIRAQLKAGLDVLEQTTGWMLRTGAADPDSVLAGSTPYLRIWGLVVGGWLLAKSALAARELDGDGVAAAQLPLARFYAEQLLPAASGLAGAATAGSRDLFALDADALGDVVRRTARV
jgi:hypothetical protein